MNLKSVICIAFILLLSQATMAQGVSSFDVQVGQQTVNSVVVDPGENERKIGFLLYVPANYEELESLPLVMFMHGMGERGDDLDLVKKWGPPKKVTEGKEFPFILVSPQCPKDITWQPSHLVQVLDAIEGQLKVDKKRVYMTGLSMGGYATWGLLSTIPERIAAAVPICGGGKPATAESMVDVPIWAFHGTDDRVVGIERSQSMVDAVNEAGGNAKLTSYDGVGHNSWSETYANQEVYDWMLSKTLDRDE